MALKTYNVNFLQPTFYDEIRTLYDLLAGPNPRVNSRVARNLSTLVAAGALMQVRDLRKIGDTFTGVFVKLRDDVGSAVNLSTDREHDLPLEEDDRVAEKAYFLYKGAANVFAMQVNKVVGGTTRLNEYFSHLAQMKVTFNYYLDHSRHDHVFNGTIYEVEYSYARPRRVQTSSSVLWSRGEMRTMNDAHAAHGVFRMRAPRGDCLNGDFVKGMIRAASGDPWVKKVKVRLDDESKLTDLVITPITEKVKVETHGRYPNERDMYQELEGAFDSHIGEF